MKSPFSTSFILLISLLNITVYSNDPLKNQAQNWVNTYIFNLDGTPRLSAYDIKAVANLIYLSWTRSAMTIKCQQELLDILGVMWKGWQNVAQTRLDPSIDLPYSIPQEQQKATQAFWELAERHRSIGITYTYAVKMILEKQIVQTPLALDGIADMRDKARKVVLDSLLDIRKQLGQFFNTENKDIEIEQESFADEQPDQPLQDEATKNINLMEYIYAYIPQLALHSFIEANNLQNLVSEEGWHALKTIQEVGNRTWNAIEETRAEFYSVYYATLFDALRTSGLHNECLKVMFDEQGIIQKDQQEILLPVPYKLSSSIM